jgi:hypothetical protein
LKHWSFAKTNSQGVSAAPMLYFAYNRILELIDTSTKEKFDLKPEMTANMPIPNNIIEFKDERELKIKS